MVTLVYLFYISGDIMAQLHHKVSPISLRALPSQKNLTDRAALSANKSRSDFMLETACKECADR